MIKFIELKDKLKSGTVNALCLFGNDEWLKQRCVENVRQAYSIADDGFATDTLENPTLEQITDACMTLPMFCDKKLVVCRDFVFPENARLAQVKKQLSQIISACDGSFCLVFRSDTDKYFADINGMLTVNCNRLDKPGVVKWIVAYAKRQGVQIDTLCADRIATYCLSDMSRVSVETQKLIDYGTVDAQSVDMLVHRDAEYAVYDLSGAIADKNAMRAMEIYRGLIAGGEEVRSLFALLYNFYRRMYYVKTSAYPPEQIAAYLGVKPGAVGFARSAAERYKPMQLKRALDCLAQADDRLKNFSDEDETFVLLIMQLISL